MKDVNSVAARRLKAFFDSGTFVELGAYISRPGAADTAEGVVCGYGAMNGRLVFAFAQDSAPFAKVVLVSSSSAAIQVT